MRGVRFSAVGASILKGFSAFLGVFIRSVVFSGHKGASQVGDSHLEMVCSFPLIYDCRIPFSYIFSSESLKVRQKQRNFRTAGKLRKNA